MCCMFGCLCVNLEGRFIGILEGSDGKGIVLSNCVLRVCGCFFSSSVKVFISVLWCWISLGISVLIVVSCVCVEVVLKCVVILLCLWFLVRWRV